MKCREVQSMSKSMLQARIVCPLVFNFNDTELLHGWETNKQNK